MGEVETSQESPSEEQREGNTVLPLEMLEKIFWLLPARDLKTVVLVCKRWKEAADNPKLWTYSVKFTYDLDRCMLADGEAPRDSDKDVNFMQEASKVRRFETVRKIKINFCPANVFKPVIEGALQHAGLRELHLEQGDVSAIDPDTLSQFLTRMEEVKITMVEMTLEQTTSFLRALHNTHQIKTLLWDHPNSFRQIDNVNEVDPTLLANAVKNVERLELRPELTREQARSLFQVLQEDGSSVKWLSLEAIGNNPRNYVNGENTGPIADPESMGRAIVKLEVADFRASSLTEGENNLRTDQITAMLTAIAAGKSTLQKLILRGNRLNQVDPQVLAGMVRELDELNLQNTLLTTEQMDQMFETIGTLGPGKLRQLILAGNDLSDVNHNGLALMVTDLVALDLTETKLCKEQVDAIFSKLAESPGKLKKLVLEGIDLREVEAELIAGMVTEVKWLNIKGTRLTTIQLDQIFETLAEGPGNLRNLKIDYNDLRGVDPDVMANAVNRLDSVSMSDMPFLTRYQMKTILTQALEEGSYLKYLDIGYPYSSNCRNKVWKRGEVSVFDDKFGNQNQNLRDELFGQIATYCYHYDKWHNR